jgi:hypothetical protein
MINGITEMLRREDSLVEQGKAILYLSQQFVGGGALSPSSEEIDSGSV